MKCSSCGVEINKIFALAYKRNECPSCGNKIVASGNPGAFVQLCSFLSEKIEKLSQSEDVGETEIESLAADLINEFNIRLKTDVAEETAFNANAASPSSSALSEKEKLRKLRDEAYNDAIREQWGMSGEVNLDEADVLSADIGEVLAEQMSGTNNAAALALEQKKRAASRNIETGMRGSFKRV